MENLLGALWQQAQAGRGNQGWSMGGGSSQAVEALNSEDEAQQMQAVHSLCTELNMATPLSLTINTHAIVPPLLGCLRKAHNPELQLMAARALTYMADSLPRTLDILSSGGNVHALLEPIAAVQDIELAEQCISCIEKLCQTSSGAAAAFRANGIDTMLTFVDFFTISTQRQIWVSISRMCKGVDTDNFDSLRNVLPTMRASVVSAEAKVCERAVTALLRIACGVRKEPRMVDAVFDGMPPTLVGIITRPSGQDATFSGALSLILAAVSFSDAAIRQVVESGLLSALLHLLDGSASSVATGVDDGDLRGASSVDHASLSASAAPAAGAAFSGTVASPTGVSAASGARHSLSFENSKVLCSIFTAMLVPNREGPFAYIEQLMELELKEAAARLTAPVDTVAARGDGGGGEPEGAAADDDDDFEDTDDSDADEEEDEHESENEGEGHGMGGHGRGMARQDRLEALRQRILSTPGLHLRLQGSHTRVRSATHVCDGCNKVCELGDWYRCNECRDTDFCGSCLLKMNLEHFGGVHTFTDMHALHEAAAARPKGHSSLELVELAMYKREPQLLAEVLRAVPKVVVLCTQAEAAVIRISGMNFLLSAAAMAPAELLVSSGMCGPHVCEAALAAITDPSTLLNITGVALVGKLLEKLPDSYAHLLGREGVTHALVQLQTKYPAPVAALETSEETLLRRRVLTSEGWREIIGAELASLFQRFPALSRASTSASLQKLNTLLDARDLDGASVALREALADRTTAFEFMQQSVFAKLKECFLRCGDNVDPVLRFLVSLCQRLPSEPTTSGPGLCHLHALVHLLHTALARLDNFAAPSFGPLRSIHVSVPLQLMPHKPGSSSASQPSGKTTTTTTGAGKKDSRRSSGQGEPTDVSGGSVANVNIEPLADVRAICDFIARNLLRTAGAGKGPRRGLDADGDADGKVEEVLPELGEGGAGNVARPVAKRKKREDDPPSIWVRYENHVLPLSMTAAQLVYRYVNPSRRRTARRGEEDSVVSARGPRAAPMKPVRLFYSAQPFESSYEMASVAAPMPSTMREGPAVVLPTADARPPVVGRVLAAVRQSFPHSRAHLNQAQMDILTLLGVLYEVLASWSELLEYLNRTAPALARRKKSQQLVGEEDEAVWSPAVSRLDLVHHKLNNKAMRHCSNLLLAGLHATTWAVNLALDCNFLFTESTRRYLFEVSFCGAVRSLARMQQNLAKYGVRDSSSADHTSPRSFALIREKKRVWREHALECAMELLGGERVSGAYAWEFEYYGETGSGLGPTREFYTLVAQALQERARRLWRQTTGSDADTYYTPLNGLYPRPLAREAPAAEVAEMARYFKFMGRFIGRALLDEHVASLPLSPVFIKLLRGDVCGVHDLRLISESVHDVLLAMMTARAAGTGNIQLPGQKKSYPVESMSLPFTLPGDDAVELKPKGATLDVTRETMGEYCDAVTDHMMNVGVRTAVMAMREGFNDYIPLTALRMLSVEEIFEVVHGHATPISRTEFEEHCSADHGFTVACKHVQWLFDILASFTVEEQKRFFLFLTGSPHLPVGGLASLRPKLTIVRKTASEPSVKETDQLPSAMTCQNYLKLPAYDSKEQMQEKLMHAIDEGTGAFLLS